MLQGYEKQLEPKSAEATCESVPMQDVAGDARAERYAQRGEVRSGTAMAPELDSFEGSDSEFSASSGSDSDFDEAGQQQAKGKRHGDAEQPDRAQARTARDGRSSRERAWRPQREASLRDCRNRKDRGGREYSLRQRTAGLNYAMHDSEEEESSEPDEYAGGKRKRALCSQAANARDDGCLEYEVPQTTRYQQLGSNGSASSEETDVDELADADDHGVRSYVVS